MTASDTEEGLRSEPLRTFMARSAPERTPLLAPLLDSGTQALMFADAGRGKSMLALSMALAVASGGSFLGFSAPSPARVLYLDGEMGTRDMQERVKLLTPAVQGTDAARMGDNLLIYSYTTHGGTLDLGTPRGCEALLKHAVSEEADMVILDNLTTLARLEDENAGGSFDTIIDLHKTLRAKGIVALMLHHTGKGGDRRRARGSSRLEAPYDLTLPLLEYRRAGQRGTAFEFNIGKDRHGIARTCRHGYGMWLERGEGGAAKWVAAEPEDYEDGARVDKKAAKGRRDAEAAAEAVRSRECSTMQEVGDRLGVSKGEASKRLKRAVAFGLLTQDDRIRCFKEAEAARARGGLKPS